MVRHAGRSDPGETLSLEARMVTDAGTVGYDSKVGLEVRIKDGLCWNVQRGGIY